MNKTALHLSIVSGLVFMLAVPALADLQAGFEAYDRGDYETTLNELLPLAEQGDSDVQGLLGVMYQLSWGVPQDDQEAVGWYRLGAEEG